MLSAAKQWRGEGTKRTSGRRQGRQRRKKPTRLATLRCARGNARYCLVLRDVSTSNRVVCACALRGVVRVQATCFWGIETARAAVATARTSKRISPSLLLPSPSHPSVHLLPPLPPSLPILWLALCARALCFTLLEWPSVTLSGPFEESSCASRHVVMIDFNEDRAATIHWVEDTAPGREAEGSA